MRYGELSREMSDISTKMLTQTLKELETDNLIHRKMYLQVPPKVEYSLTETGKELIPFIKYLVDWGYTKIAGDSLE
ncbi:winged helix-turn-helix transcriptional regulator [Bacteroides fragilis]|nr:winged helix-turn-helix transcriptional regulator [Bacteroides fragilis]